MRYRIILLSCFFWSAFGLAAAQTPGLNSLQISVASGPLANPTKSSITAWTDTVVAPGFDSMQLHFGVANLDGPGDRLVLRSLEDGAEQVFSAESLRNWENHSAWFNGSAVQVSVILGPGSTGELSVDLVWLRVPDAEVESICGPNDDRVLTTETRVCRVFSSLIAACSSPTGTTTCGNSAFLISNTSTILTSRSVTSLSSFSIAEFNVPLSTAAGAVVHSAPDDQYPIDRASIVQSAAAVVGDDWAVARLHPNANGQTASAQQGAPYVLATAIPATGTQIRITGFGVDSTPDLTRHNSCQTHVGPLQTSIPTTVRYQVDTTSGSIGSPVLNAVTGQVIGIHTTGGCSDPVIGTANSGTSILNSGLQAAIAAVSGCASASLSLGVPTAITCTDTIFDVSPLPNRWVGVGITSTSDWNVAVTAPGTTTTVTSALTSTSCDYVIANGHLGAVAAASGRFSRNAGASNASAEFQDADLVTVGSPLATSWTASRVLRLFEFEVTAAGTFDLSVFGDSSLNWRLYTPGTTAGWRERASTTLASSGSVGGSGSTNVALGAGWHGLIVYRNNGTATPNPSELIVGVCPTGTTTVLTEGTPAAITDSCTRFSLTPVAGSWNVVGIASTSPWSLGIGTAWSSGSTNTQFAVANGTLGTVSPSVGRLWRSSGTAPGTVQHCVATLPLPVGSSSSFVPLAGGALLAARRFSITTAGNYNISVTGGSGTGLFWRVFEPGTSAAWRSRTTSIGSSSEVGASPVSKTLGVGEHLLVIYRNGDPESSQSNHLVTICPTSSSTLALVGTAVTTISAPCQPFTCSPVAGRWNVVGITSAADWDVGLGNGIGSAGIGANDFVVQDGYQGLPSTSTGMFSRVSGTETARAQLGPVTALTTGSIFNTTWAGDAVVRMYECTVITTDSYDITVSGAPDLQWRLYAPTAHADWQVPLILASRFGDAPRTTRLLSPGVYGLVVYRNGAPAALPYLYQVHFRETPNPVPVLNSLSLSSIPVGTTSFTFDALGTGFLSGQSVVLWNGTPLATTFQSSIRLRATVPGALRATAATIAITVYNPPAGGGTSGAAAFEVHNPSPVLSMISPSTIVFGGASFAVILSGSNFNSSTVAHWNGMPLATTLLGSSQVSATVPASLIAASGIAAVTASNPPPGGGGSSAESFTILNPVPTASSIAPTSVIAGGPGFTLTVDGAGFLNPESVVRLDGIDLCTTYVNSGQLTATVTASQIQASGSSNVTVFNSGPGGGTSSIRSLTKRRPILNQLGSTSIPIMGPTSPPVNLAVTGVDFLPSAVVYADGIALTTTFVSSTQLQALVGPNVPGTQQVGGLAIAVENSHFAPSSARGLAVGGGSNEGTIVLNPLDPFPGEVFSIVLEEGRGSAPLSLIIDFSAFAPIFPFPDPVANLVLSVRPDGFGQPGWALLSDAIGLYGPPSGFTYNVVGRIVIPGLVRPNPPLMLSSILQGVYLDPTAPYGIRITLPRYAGQI